MKRHTVSEGLGIKSLMFSLLVGLPLFLKSVRLPPREMTTEDMGILEIPEERRRTIIESPTGEPATREALVETTAA